MSVRETIVAVFSDVARDQSKHLPVLTDDTPLLDLELDSLCLAIIVARLEGSLGSDPFSESDEVGIPATFGEFVAMYEKVGA
jgi:hypothetical protein